MRASGYLFDTPTWCRGCGHFGALGALRGALADLDRAPHQVALVTGVGCSAKANEYTRAYGLHGLHGRALSVATGLRLMRPDLTVVVMAGDGDCYGIGAGHLLHTARRDLDLACLVFDNRVYGLTKGQDSPTTPQGAVTSTTPGGSGDRSLNPLALALAAGAGFVAQGFSGAGRRLRELVRDAIAHPGFALVNVLSPCVTFDRDHDYGWYRERLRPVDHDPADLAAAMAAALKPLPQGLLYRREGRREGRRETESLRYEPAPLSPEHFQRLVAERGGPL